MSDDVNVRKTISQTHRQAALSYGGVAALSALLAGPLSGYFQTKGEAAAMDIKVASIQSMVADLKKTTDDNDKEAIRRQERVSDKIMLRIGESETRVTSSVDKVDKRVDRTDTRMDTLEAAVLGRARRSPN
jgi:hypothetical protein